MIYSNIRQALFLERLNRFVARVEIDGREELAHVKNTGRCRELLIPGCRVWLERSGAAERKTAYDLVAVEKETPEGLRLINMDSMAPNRAAAEWLSAGGLGALESLRAEVTIGDSRYDFCARQGGRFVAIEVKGCTLEVNGEARFPDAPTQRGIKHVRGLIELVKKGWRCILLIVIQMDGVRFFRPSWETHGEFGEALLDARAAGVEIIAMDCRVIPGSVEIQNPVRVELEKPMARPERKRDAEIQ